MTAREQAIAAGAEALASTELYHEPCDRCRSHATAVLDAAVASGAVVWADEMQDVLNAINIYGDETLHQALDDIGWKSRAPIDTAERDSKEDGDG